MERIQKIEENGRSVELHMGEMTTQLIAREKGKIVGQLSYQKGLLSEQVTANTVQVTAEDYEKAIAFRERFRKLMEDRSDETFAKFYNDLVKFLKKYGLFGES